MVGEDIKENRRQMKDEGRGREEKKGRKGVADKTHRRGRPDEDNGKKKVPFEGK